MPTTSESRGVPPRRLSDSLRLLCVGRKEPSWTGLALQLDRLGCTEPRFRWCASQAAAAALLRDEGFDIVVIGDPAAGDTDPLVFLEALRESGFDDTALIVSSKIDDAWLLRCGERDVEVCPAASGCDSRALATWIRRAIDRAESTRDHQRLLLAERKLDSENREGSSLMTQQWERLFPATSNESDVPVRPELAKTYGELLRTYVFFGAGRLTEELDRLALIVQHAQLPAAALLRLHGQVLSSLASGCGSRSIRRLQQNADLFAVELLTRVADGYRLRSGPRGLGDHGIDLLHAESMRQK